MPSSPTEHSTQKVPPRGLKKLTKLSKKFFRTLTTYIPAYAKLSAMMGGSAFNAAHFSSLVLNRKNGLDNPFGIALASTLVVGVGSSNYVMRFRNMVRITNPNTLHVCYTDEECSCEPKYSVHHAGWLTPDKRENKHPIGYIISQTAAGIYMITSSSAGYLNAYSLIAILPAIIPSITFNPECGLEQSSAKALIPAFVLALVVAYSTPRSFHFYNLERIRSYYHTFIYHGRWREIKTSTYIHAGLGVLSNTVNGFFANRHMLNMLVTNALCNVGVSEIPYAINEFILYLSALVNFMIQGMMTIPAVHYSRNNNTTALINQQLDHLPQFKRFNKLIYFSILLDTVNELMSTFLSTYLIKKTVLNEEPELDFSTTGIILMVVALMMAFGVAAPNNFALDREAYRKELNSSDRDQIRASLTQAPPVRDEENPPDNTTDQTAYQRLPDDQTKDNSQTEYKIPINETHEEYDQFPPLLTISKPSETSQSLYFEKTIPSPYVLEDGRTLSVSPENKVDDKKESPEFMIRQASAFTV